MTWRVYAELLDVLERTSPGRSRRPRRSPRGWTLQELARQLSTSFPRIPRREVARLVRELVALGALIRRGRHYLRSPRAVFVVGTLKRHRRGFLLVTPEGERARQKYGDIHVRESHAGTALHGDRVLVRVLGRLPADAPARAHCTWEGRVERILERAQAIVVGRFMRTPYAGYVLPLDERFLYEIEIAPGEALEAEDGQIVAVELLRSPTAHHPPVGRIVEILGRDGDPGLDEAIVIRKYRLPYRFSESALREAAALPDSVHDRALRRERLARDEPKRRDFRGWVTVTIDGESARDFDDAVSVERLPDGSFLLGVHIADVSAYVPEGSALDVEARERGTSVYFPDRVLPMLPERLSEDLCSLKPGVDRAALSVLMKINRRGDLLAYELCPSVIRSQARLTYTFVNELLSGRLAPAAREAWGPSGRIELSAEASFARIADALRTMAELGQILIERRHKRGAIAFDLPEPVVLFDDEGRIGGIIRAERNLAHRMIEEFMILANETVARHLARGPMPMIYRVHEPPEAERVREFLALVKALGFSVPRQGLRTPRDFQHLVRQFAERREGRVLSLMMLRSFRPAIYSTENRGHFGLALEHYTHFTSPIRRYPDLVVHRLLRRALTRPTAPVRPREREALERIAEHCTERERLADEAEREILAWKRARFMAERIGQEYEGIIVSVKEYGFYVELEEVFIEGLVHLSTLTDDRYDFDPKRYALVGRRGKRRFRLGDVVRVRVARVDVDHHLVDFVLVGMPESRRRAS